VCSDVLHRHLQPTIVESALCCPCLEPLFSLGSQTACTHCTFSTLPGVIVPRTGSQPSYTASSEQAPIHFAAENSISGTILMGLDYVFSFLDDDGVFSKSREQHWTHLRMLFTILAVNGLACVSPLSPPPSWPWSLRCPWPTPSVELFSPWLQTPPTPTSERSCKNSRPSLAAAGIFQQKNSPKPR
jgi:hypothetical protein